MYRTPTEALEAFVSRLTPTEAETNAAKLHRQSVRDSIAENLGLLSFFRTGSFGNGTSVSGFSDVDYFGSPKLLVGVARAS
jgi:tRNA nucleotidyltransferase (CCA-adding enzyme)